MSPDKRHLITVYAQTDVGMVRAGNEDTFLVLNLDTADTWTPVTIEGDPPEHLAAFEQTSAGTILAVSDGMGGALAGEVASRMAVEGVRDHMLFFKGNAAYSGFPFHERLRLAVEQANSQINNESMGNADYAGMGATFTAAGVHDGMLTLAQIGDSRCYMMRGNRIALVTHDQSLVWQLVEAGHITEEEAETHQYKNVILQALGAQPRVNVVVDRIALSHGDTILLCSDGLSGRVRAEEMLEIVTKTDSLRAACEQLIQLANDRGGEDNITVVLARFEGDSLPPPGDLTSERVDRDPNLPYDVDDTIVDGEPTLSPDALIDDDAEALGSEESPAKGFSSKITNRLSSAPPAQTALLDPSQVPTTSGSSDGEITPEVAEQIAQLNDRTDFAVPTSVGIPMLTPELIAEQAKLMAEASRNTAETPPKHAPPATPADALKSANLKGIIVAIGVFVVLVTGAWYVYRQQAQAAAERDGIQEQAQSLKTRAGNAHTRLERVTSNITSMAAGPDHEKAQALHDSIAADLKTIESLVSSSDIAPGAISQARSLCDEVDGKLTTVETLAQPPAAPPAQPPAETPR